MKKSIAFVLLFALAFSLLPISAYALPEGTEAAVTYSGTPRIDGKIDEIWNSAQEFEAKDFQLYYWTSNPKTATGKIKTLWDNEYFYILAQVTTDPNFDFTAAQESVWERDSIGVFVDYSYKRDADYKYATSNGDLYEYLNIQADGKYYQTYGTSSLKPENYPEVRIVSEKTETGYNMEIALPLSKTDLKIGDKIGFDVNICEADGGKRVGITGWNAYASDMWQYSQVLGTLTLAGSNAAEEKPEEKPEEKSESPVTGDPITYIILISILSLSLGGAYIISLRKIKTK